MPCNKVLKDSPVTAVWFNTLQTDTHIPLASPLLPGSVREDSEDLFVQQRHLLEPRQLLSELYLQTVASTVFPFQMLDGADTSDREKQTER